MINPMKQFGELTAFLKNAGINFSQVLGLLTGKPDRKQVSDVLRPVMIRYAPYVGQAIRHKETQYGRQCVLIISSQEDESGNTVEALTFATVGENGGFEPKETIPLYEIVDYIINSVGEANESESHSVCALPPDCVPKVAITTADVAELPEATASTAHIVGVKPTTADRPVATNPATA